MLMVINGRKVNSVSGECLEVTNPATKEVIDTVPSANAEDVDLAVAAAVAGQKIWAKYSIYDRSTILYRFVRLVEENAESLARLLSNETGKPITQARAEIGNISIGFPAFIEKAKHLYDFNIPAGTEAGQAKNMQITVREPIGVVVCIIPFNFPCDLFDQKVAPALIMGNAAIVLPSLHNPLTLCYLSSLMIDAGVPAGVMQIITGKGPEVGPLLIQHKDVNFLSLTGSTEVGIQSAKRAMDHLARVALELGGNDAFIVLDDADVDLAANEVVWGRLYNAGQVCCASKRFIVHNSIKDVFAKKVIALLQKQILGDPSKEETTIGCLISEEAAIRVEAQVLKTVEEGAKILYGGKREGAYYEPTVLADVPQTAEIMKDMEVFGPVIPITGFDTTEEAVNLANASRYGLSGCVFSENMKKAMQVASALECGGAVINGASFFRSFEMPFGGYKYSGIGTEGVSTTLEHMSLVKTIVLKNIL